MAGEKGLSYDDLGASATKDEVHAAIDGMEGGLFPNAFCKIVPDIMSNDESQCLLLHADGAGTKSIPAYLWYREKGDASKFAGIAQDSTVMNLDDMVCVGATSGFVLSNTIGRNKFLVPGEAIGQIISGYTDFCSKMGGFGIDVALSGGETADLGDLVRTVVVDSTIFARMSRSDVITTDEIRPDDVIVGLSSTGQAAYEDKPNSGIGSNGLTLARHALISSYYRDKYPEIVDPGVDVSKTYVGSFKLDDTPSGLGMSVGDAILSPTRTFAPIIKDVLSVHRSEVSAIFHCTGGGQGKCLRFGKGIRYVKDDMFPTPPVFALIQKEGNVDWKEMYRTFNMGHRMEVVVRPSAADEVISMAKHHGVDAKVIGRCEASSGANSVTIDSENGKFEYGL